MVIQSGNVTFDRSQNTSPVTSFPASSDFSCSPAAASPALPSPTFSTSLSSSSLAGSSSDKLEAILSRKPILRHYISPRLRQNVVLAINAEVHPVLMDLREGM